MHLRHRPILQRRIRGDLGGENVIYPRPSPLEIHATSETIPPKRALAGGQSDASHSDWLDFTGFSRNMGLDDGSHSAYKHAFAAIAVMVLSLFAETLAPLLGEDLDILRWQ